MFEREDPGRTGAQYSDQLAKFHALFSKSPSFAAVLGGRDHRFVATNPSYQRLIGGREVIGRTVADALPEVADQDFLALLDRVFTSGEPYVGRAVPLLVEREQGAGRERRFIDFVYQPVRAADGAVIAIFVEGTDVTDAQAATERLRESEAWNRQILDAATDHAIIALDPEGRVTRWNAGAETILGWSEAEMVGRSASCIFAEEDRAIDRLATEMRAAAAAGRGVGEGWRVRKSGERFWASGETTPIRDAQGDLLGFVKVLRDRTAEHVTAEVLRHSEEMLQRAQSAGGVGVFSVDVADNVLTASPEFCRIFGVPKRGVVSAASIEKLVLPEDAERISSAQARSAAAIELVTEYRIKRADDGAIRWIARRAEFETDAAGHPVRLVGVVQDVTERREAARALGDSEARFRAFTEAVPNQVWSATRDGLIDWVNGRASDYAGQQESSWVGEAWARLVHPDDVAIASERWRRSLETGADYETEFRLRHHSGSYRWHLARAVALRDDAGAIVRWVGTNTDIEDRRVAAIALAELNHTLEERVDRATRERDRAWKNSRDLQAVLDGDGVFQAVNDAWSTILGYPSGDVVGRSYLDFIHPDDHPSSEQALAMATADQLEPYENRYRHADGGFRWISWVAAPEGGLVYASGRHVTADKEAAVALEAAQEQLRQAQKMEAVGQLTGGVAHDFNNLLTVIRGSVELLAREDITPERRRRYVAAIGETAERASRLTGQLLAFARRQSLTPEIFDVGESLTRLAEMIQTLAGSRLELQLVLPTESCTILADRSQFDTSIVNMAINARDAMAGQGKLTIGVGLVSGIPAIRGHAPVVGEFVAVTVTDTGEGIAAEDLFRIFEPFYTTKGVGAGTGLGLSQVIGFAKQSGGDIRVDSELGAGATFTLYLPRATDAAADYEPERLSRGSTQGHGLRVLVVEDNEQVGEFATDALQQLGYDSVLAPDGASALAELEADSARFHVVFSDVVMPGMSGMDLAAHIRERHPGLPVVLTSGYSHVLAQNGTHGFELLHKPYSIEQLSRILRKSVDWGGRAARPAPAD
ncbi:PAS domain S-box protein [uncultured Sphingomonas sp.]|uniref:PAS domain S-box protein n=1 Tax=uncultured Sphingomonas sp. TaxID=158754 RepID=UPI0035CC6DE3